ncbi:putative serine/threonine-protein kinase [Salvia miltiorrhiza]|uniref:putative serine/threonine-protein kinase n=1 Tax=Salvia miltiorrhiza TaxID=226208 RepID=UPI0025AD41FF|nr:putative serine/threonine-protein kinase [Salvia miltiorrhiza]XP_057794971.1 putative serine/threonine-protein kinase [Salvia miltiorrhiza]
MDRTLQAILAAIASFFVVSVILASILIICKSESKQSSRRSSIPQSRARNLVAPKPNAGPGPVAICDSATFDPSLPHVSMQELVAATQGFSSELIIGDGSFGLVYKARLNSGAVVAVKKLSPDAFQGLREFRAEMETLGKIQHPNIVRMLGFCATGQDRLLIYEFIEKGSLDQWLYDTSDREQEPLSWLTRLNIVRGVADGLAFMHHKLETPIIHRDIKASNILLDADFQVHIADFGLARRIEASHSHVSTQVAGTMGYMPPEYLDGATTATMAGDVYSFGVLMLEVVTGRRPSFPFPGEDGREVRLVEWVKRMAGMGRYLEMVDACIAKEDLHPTKVEQIFQIGVNCADEKSRNRPTMNQLLDHFNLIL